MFFTTKIKNPEETQTLQNDFSIPSSISIEEVQENTTIDITYESLRQQIRELAYYKWEQAGHPWGRDKEFWIESEKELFGENALESGGYKVKYNNSYVLISPINSEVPIKINAEDFNK